MRAVIELFWNLCRLRVGPEAMPSIGVFVVAVVLVNLAVSIGVALSSPVAARPVDAVTAPVVAAAVLATATWLVLRVRSLAHRFTQTFTALMGADVVITLLSWPLVLLMSAASGDPAMQLGLTLGQFALLFWWITISGFVFSSALDGSRAQGVAVAVFVVLATLMVTASLFPPTAPAGGSGAPS